MHQIRFWGAIAQKQPIVQRCLE